jgi:streptogramin lyase
MGVAQVGVIKDEPFLQEYHEAYPFDGSIRKILADRDQHVWIATANGIWKKNKDERIWSQVLSAGDRGPAFSLASDDKGRIWMGTWNAVWRMDGKSLKKINGTEGPISVLFNSPSGIYAVGPLGLWSFNGTSFIKHHAIIPKSVRDAVADEHGELWLASDVGVYHLIKDSSIHIVDTSILISAAQKGVAFNKDRSLWTVGLGGINILRNSSRIKSLTSADGCPSVFVNTVSMAPDGSMWVGTRSGIVRYHTDGSHTLRFSRRWLMHDNVTSISFDGSGTAWIGTDNGVSAIKKMMMTLEDKSDHFYDVLMRRHIRAPWIAGQCKLAIPGDTSSWKPDDDDNDGEYTGNYLAMESFRYAVTKNNEAKQNAKKAFGFLKFLQDVTGSKGYFARTIVPIDWTGALHDTNRTYTSEEIADEMVKEPRFKPVAGRWRKSQDGKWLWKGDASSDEMCGHMFGYFFYYELVADKDEKKIVASHIASIVDHLIKNNYNMMDVDGSHTRWSVWSPDKLNHDPEWLPDKYQNSMELLTFLKLAYHVTGNSDYEKRYRHLINEEHYLQNMANIKYQNPAWFIYFDVILQAYLYPILIKCEEDPQLRDFYNKHMDEWMERRRCDKNPLINFIYCYSRNKKVELEASHDLLKDTPLDLVSWPIDHRRREDISIVHSPVLDEDQVSELPPASIRATIRWDANPWQAVNGDPSIEREPVFWLLPYWMGRYLKMIE